MPRNNSLMKLQLPTSPGLARSTSSNSLNEVTKRPSKNNEITQNQTELEDEQQLSSLRRIKSTPSNLHSLIKKCSSSTDLKASSTSTKLQRRLAKKAEAARQSRRRKKAYIKNLEDKIVLLQKKLQTLQMNDTTGKEKNNTQIIKR
jgi:hypothetical protein